MAALKRKNEDNVEAFAAGPRHSERLLKKTKTLHVKEKRGAVKQSRTPVRGKVDAQLSSKADARLARMAELKAAFGKVATALKPVLAEIAQRTENEIVADNNELENNQDYQSAMQELDIYLAERKEIEANRLRIEIHALDQKRLGAESLIKREYERRAIEIKEKLTAHITFDMMNIIAGKGDEGKMMAPVGCTTEYYSEKDNCFKWMPAASDEDKTTYSSYVTIPESSVRYEDSLRHNAPNGVFYAEMEAIERSSAGQSETRLVVEKIAKRIVPPQPLHLQLYQRPNECQRMAKRLEEDCTADEKKLLARQRSDDFFLTLIGAADTEGLDKALVGQHGVKEYFKRYGRPQEYIANLP